MVLLLLLVVQKPPEEHDVWLRVMNSVEGTYSFCKKKIYIYINKKKFKVSLHPIHISHII
jgi:hypothetical protein